MNNILYYPYINLPETNWTLRALLYYENVGSMVPREYFYRAERYDQYMLELIRNELVTPIDPMAVLRNSWNSTKPFLDLIERHKNRLRTRQNDFIIANRGLVHDEKLAMMQIHADKFNQDLFHGLEELGLAKRINENWYSVEQRTANNLMKYLATLISAETNRLPTTDIVTFHSRRRNVNEQRKRETILTKLIPFPEDIDLRKLMAFKERHADLLRAFRTRVELITLDPNIAEGTPLFEYHLAELDQRKQELAEKMKENKFKSILFGTVCGLIGAYHGLATASSTDAMLGALPGFANAVYSALKIQKPENFFDQSGLKYLALAEKRIIKKQV